MKYIVETVFSTASKLKKHQIQWYRALSFCMLIALVFSLTSCTSNGDASDNMQPSESPQTEHFIQGAVEDILMNTLIMTTEDGQSYEFDKSQAEIITGSGGILIGNPVTVHFYGELSPAHVFQDIEVTSIVVKDAKFPPESNTITPVQPSLTIEEKAQKLLTQMSLEEKVGQMFIARAPEENAAEKAADYHLGGYILFARDFEGKTKEQVIQDIQSYQDAASIPMLIGVDEEGGTVNRVSKYSAFRSSPFQSPQKLYQDGGFDAIIRDTAEKSQLLHQLGINLNFAPVCDVSQNSYDFIYSRTFGKDASQTAQYVETVVKIMNEQGIGSVLKHFPGYGNNEDTHTGIAYDDRPYDTFVESDFIPFQAGINAGADVVLMSHNILNSMDSQYPASLSPRIHEILRNELDFSGVIITDDLAMDGVRNFVDNTQAAVLAVQAGNDLLCSTDFEIQIPAVLDAVAQGLISQERINESVLRILKMKLSLGLI